MTSRLPYALAGVMTTMFLGLTLAAIADFLNVDKVVMRILTVEEAVVVVHFAIAIGSSVLGLFLAVKAWRGNAWPYKMITSLWGFSLVHLFITPLPMPGLLTFGVNALLGFLSIFYLKKASTNPIKPG